MFLISIAGAGESIKDSIDGLKCIAYLTQSNEDSAYSTSAKAIIWILDNPGLKIALIHGPYTGSSIQNTPVLRKLHISYHPSFFAPYSLIRRSFGKRSFELDEENVEMTSQSYFVDVSSEVYKIYLNKLPGKEFTQSDGPLLMISRTSGKLLVWPGDVHSPNHDHLFSWKSLFSTLQNERSKSLFGKWYALEEKY